MSVSDEVNRELTIALTELRSLADPAETATNVLDRDCQVFSLIGLVDDGTNAVFYDWPIWTVRITPVTESGVGGLTAPESVCLHHYGRVETYIEERGAEAWDWLHPRYRWVFSNRTASGSKSARKANS